MPVGQTFGRREVLLLRIFRLLMISRRSSEKLETEHIELRKGRGLAMQVDVIFVLRQGSEVVGGGFFISVWCGRRL